MTRPRGILLVLAIAGLSVALCFLLNRRADEAETRPPIVSGDGAASDPRSVSQPEPVDSINAEGSSVAERHAADVVPQEPARPTPDTVAEAADTAPSREVVLTKPLPSDVEYFADASTPLANRKRRLREMGNKRDAACVRTLLNVAASEIYLNAAAVEQLGWIDKPQVHAFLEELVSDSSTMLVRRLCAAIEALAHLQGEEAVDDIAVLLKENRSRNDGLNELVEGTCITTLGKLESPRAVPILAEELELFGKEARQDLDYGVAVARALWASDKGADEVKHALRDFTDQLDANLVAYLDRTRKEFASRGETKERIAQGELMVRRSYESTIKQIEGLMKEM